MIMGAPTQLDQTYMLRCLELARQAEGRTSPNPMVGAVVLDSQGNVVGEGYHKKAGTAHAEVNALDQAGAAARGGTLYVNLEPCCHFGKTPPCAQRVIASGVKRVVVGTEDPNPVVAGGGLKELREAGMDVYSGLCEDECRRLNRGFLKRIKTGLPWICLKIAATLDGKIADRNYNSRWISGDKSRQRVHELRNLFDSVLVGSNTVLKDDPELTVRLVAGGRNPVRISFDASLKIDPSSRFCQTDPQGRAVIYCTKESFSANTKPFPSNVSLVQVKCASGTSSRLDLESMLRDIASQQHLNTVLCEGGGRLAASLLELNLVDEIYWIAAAKILGDEEGVPAVDGHSPIDIAQSLVLKGIQVEALDNDIWIHATL